MTDCERLRDRLPDYLAGELGEDDRRAAADHIAACAECRAEVEEVAAMWSRLGLLPAEQPSSRLREGFYAMLEDYRENLTPRRALPLEGKGYKGAEDSIPRAWFTFRRPAFAVAFSLAVLAVGLGAGWLARGRAAGPGSVAELRREASSMRQAAALALLDRPSAADRLQGVSYSAGVSDPDARTLQALVRTLETDSSVNVRLAAVDALYLFRNEPGVRDSLVRNVTAQPSPLVKAALIDLLVEIRETKAAQALKQLLQDRTVPEPVKEHAQKGLEVLL